VQLYLVQWIVQLCCAVETNKWKLIFFLFWEQRTKQECFNGVSMDCVPVLYYANKHAQVTSKVCWYVELQRKLRKTLEGLDKYVAYRYFKFFENIQFGILI
jgi:hypothetical protein